MNIQSLSNNQYNQISFEKKKPNNNGFLKKIKQKLLDKIPDKILDDSEKKVKKIDKLQHTISNPAVNRGIMGATALLLQPPIDCFNKSLDEETRKVSVCRTIAKIIAGTTVGIIVRGTCHTIVEKMTQLDGKSKLSKKLIAKEWVHKFLKDVDSLKRYSCALSTLIAILVMCVTNFAVDAPLTVKLTNLFKNWINGKEDKLKTENKDCEVNYE